MFKNKGSTIQKAVPLLRRAAPVFAIAASICLLVFLGFDSGYSGLPPTEKRYVSAKTQIASLRQDERRAQFRESWEKLAAEFQSIYDADPSWPNRPAALFRAAESLEELARRSFSRSDARKAVNCYEALALRHASSRLADDALFQAASMRATWLKDEKGALALLARIKKQYPHGDMLPRAIALEKALRASASGKTAVAAVREVSRNSADILEDSPPRVAVAPKKADDSFAGDIPLRYRAAKSRMEALQADKVKFCWRHPWEEIRDEFMRIHGAGKNRLSPPALYQAAICQQRLAQCSRLAADKKKALEAFLSVARQYPRHALADDALLNAARLQKDLPSGRDKAINLLERIKKEYPSGDMLADAGKLLALLDNKAAAKAQAPQKDSASLEQPELQVLSWDSPNKNSVRIVLEMSAPVKFNARLQEGGKGQPAKLFLDLDNATVVSDVRKGVSVQGSLLKAVRVRSAKKGSTLQFDFRDVSRFDARGETNPSRIVLSVAAGKARLPQAEPDREMVARKKDNSLKGKAIKARQVSDMASQLGLTVQRVFIDAGHGGKDPGTSHNNIMERAITLDVALTLGRLLQANGLEVIYSRTKDRTVPLSSRTRMANGAKTDLFVSIHVNAHENEQASGFETYYLDLASTPQAARVAMLENARSDKRLGDMQKLVADVMLNARASESRRLAADIQRVAIFRLKKRNYQTRSNGVKSAPFHVLCGAQMPAVLVEIGYCSNPREARNLATPAYRQAIAEGLAEGILAYRDRLQRNRTAGNSLTKKNGGAM